MPRQGLDTERIVVAAARIADAEGLDAATVARLADELGVRPPSLYNHIDSRSGVVRLIGLLGLRELGDALGGASVGRSGADALNGFAHAYRDYARVHPGRYAAAAVRAGQPGDAEWEAAASRVTDVLFAILRAWDLEGDAAVHAARSARSALHGFVELERGGGFGIPVDIDASFDELVTMLAAGLDRRQDAKA